MDRVFGIDVSEFQGNFDFRRAKEEGVRFAMIRAGYTGSSNGIDKAVDSRYEEYYRRAKEAELDVGAYWFSRATSYELGRLEADFMYHHCLKGKRFEYPIAIDVEDNIYQREAGKRAVTDAIKGFCEYLEDKGYYVIIYASENWFRNYIETDELDRYDKWVASWGSVRPTYPKNGMWQFSDGSDDRNRPIAGHDVDHDYAFKNYPTIMRNKGLNGYSRDIFYPIVNYIGESLVDALKSICVDSSLSNRARIANANGINPYLGSIEQDMELLNLLKTGKLKKDS